MTSAEIIGFSAAFCTTIAFVPQAIKVIITRDTASLSLIMYVVFTVGVALWLVYGYLNQDMALMLANFVTLMLALVILCTKLYSEHISQRRASGPRADVEKDG